MCRVDLRDIARIVTILDNFFLEKGKETEFMSAIGNHFANEGLPLKKNDISLRTLIERGDITGYAYMPGQAMGTET